MEKKVKRVIAVFMALVFIITAAMPGYSVSASSLFYTGGTEKTAGVADTQGFQAGAGNNTEPSLLSATEETPVQYGIAGDTWAGYEPVLYNAQDRQDLEVSEVATAEDIVVAAGLLLILYKNIHIGIKLFFEKIKNYKKLNISAFPFYMTLNKGVVKEKGFASVKKILKD